MQKKSVKKLVFRCRPPKKDFTFLIYTLTLFDANFLLKFRSFRVCIASNQFIEMHKMISLRDLLRMKAGSYFKLCKSYGFTKFVMS